MYIRFNTNTKKIVYMGDAKPLNEDTELYKVAEYKGEIPKYDYLTVANLREETETYIEKKINHKTVIEKEPQVQAKLVYEEIEAKDENGQIVLDEDGNKVLTSTPKWVEETIEVDVEKEIEEEIEETKTRTYLACDLVANFYPSKTEEELTKIAAKVKIKELKTKLDESDYKAIKFAEGVLTEEEYAPIREERQRYRNEINQLESLI